MGRCLSKSKVENTTVEGETTISKKQMKEKKKINRFLRFFWRRKSNKIGVFPEGSSPTDRPLQNEPETILQDGGRVNDTQSRANIFLGNNQLVRRLPPITNTPSSVKDRTKSSLEILEELRASGMIANAKPAMNGCSFDILDDKSTKLQDMPSSLKLKKETDGEGDEQTKERLEMKIETANKRRQEFLLRRKEKQMAADVRRQKIKNRRSAADENKEKENEPKSTDERAETDQLLQTS